MTEPECNHLWAKSAAEERASCVHCPETRAVRSDGTVIKEPTEPEHLAEWVGSDGKVYVTDDPEVVRKRERHMTEPAYGTREWARAQTEKVTHDVGCDWEFPDQVHQYEHPIHDTGWLLWQETAKPDDCFVCNGTGEVGKWPCSSCEGSGYMPEYAEPVEPECEHNFVDATNSHVSGGDICLSCGQIRLHAEAPEPSLQERLRGPVLDGRIKSLMDKAADALDAKDAEIELLLGAVRHAIDGLNDLRVND